MTGDAGGELDVELPDEPRHEGGGAVGGAQQRDLVFLRGGTHPVGHLDVPGDDDRGGLARKVVVHAAGALLLVELVEEGKLALSEDLHPLVVEIIKKAGQLQPRPVDLGRGDGDPGGVFGKVDHLKVKIPDQLLEGHNKFCLPHEHLLYSFSVDIPLAIIHDGGASFKPYFGQKCISKCS